MHRSVGGETEMQKRTSGEFVEAIIKLIKKINTSGSVKNGHRVKNEKWPIKPRTSKTQ